MDAQRKYRRQYAYAEYLQACQRSGVTAYSFQSFYAGMLAWKRENIKGESPEWFPGEYLRTYWSQITLKIEGIEKRWFLFVAQLEVSDRTFVALSGSCNSDAWMRCAERAYRHFGGVPYITDCTLVGASMQNAGESTRQTLSAFANFFRTVLFGARPKTEKTSNRMAKPQDVRNSSAVFRHVRKALKGESFVNLDEAETLIACAVAQANDEPYIEGRSRRQIFDEREKPQLLKLPKVAYGYGKWATRHVGGDYHFAMAGARYSVPWQYVETDVQVCLERGRVSAYSCGELIAVHEELAQARGHNVVTLPEHRPPNHRWFANRLDDRFLSTAREVGVGCVRVMKLMLRDAKREQTGFKRCKELLDLSREPHPVNLDEACRAVLAQGGLVSVERVRSAMDGLGL